MATPTITTRRVPVQTPMYDEDGFLTRPWILFFEQVQRSAAAADAPVVSLSVDGTLAIGANLAPVAALREGRGFTAAMAFVKTAPNGDDLSIQIKYGSTVWLTLTIADGETEISATEEEMMAAGVLPAATPIELHITSVGGVFPGADLSVFLFP